MEPTRLHLSTSSSTLRQCEIETNRSSRKLRREETESTTWPMSTGGVASPASTITRRWTSGNSPQFDIFAPIHLIKIFPSFCFCRLSHDGAISPLESNGLLKSKETIISLDYVRLMSLFTSPLQQQYLSGLCKDHFSHQLVTTMFSGDLHTSVSLQGGKWTDQRQRCWRGERM